MSLLITTYGQQHLLQDALANVSSGNYTGTLANVKVGLWTAANGTVSPATVLADLTEATFTGYAQKVPTFGPPYIGEDGNYAVLSNNMQFLATDAVAPNVVLGSMVIDQSVTPHKLVAVEAFQTPVAVAVANDAVNSVVKFEMPNVDYGDGTVME